MVILFPPPFTPFNLGGRCTGMAGGFRLFTGGTGGADLLPEGEGIARGGTLRESGSGSDLMIFGEVISYIPIESVRVGCSGRSCVGGVVSGRSCLVEATAILGKLLELSVLALRMAFALRSSIGGRRFSALLADFNDFCLVRPGLKRWLSCFAGGPEVSSCINSTGVMGMRVCLPPRHRSTRRLVVGLISRISALLIRDSNASFICERLYGVDWSWVFARRGWRTRR